MTVKDVAEHLAIGVSTIWRQVAKGSFPPPVRIGGCTRWRRSDIEAITAQADKAA
jgi:predicted DNA-binding transcriptional regulator AlpA